MRVLSRAGAAARVCTSRAAPHSALEFVEAAITSLANIQPRNRRARHLLALPLLGTGGGGLRRVAGDVVGALVRALHAATRQHGVDIAIVTNERPAFAALQAERQRVPGFRWPLRTDLLQEGRRLSRLAIRGKLVLFVGAGVSMGAGLPGWATLLDRLAAEVGLATGDSKREFDELSLLDKAKVLEMRLHARGQGLGERVAAALAGSHYAIGHALLCSLPTSAVVTTNYDQLLETAMRHQGQSVSVIPYAPRQHSDRFLLKMHGCVTRPDHIVLTRQDYIRFQESRAALGGILQASLITSHILFSGFSLADDNVHK